MWTANILKRVVPVAPKSSKLIVIVPPLFLAPFGIRELASGECPLRGWKGFFDPGRSLMEIMDRRTQLVRCDTPGLVESCQASINPSRASVPVPLEEVRGRRDEEIVDEYEVFSKVAVSVSWSLFVLAWISAVAAPLLVVYAIAIGAWDGLMTFLGFWLLGGIIKLPAIPAFTDLTTRGLTSWFDSFSIQYPTNNADRSKLPKRPPTIYCYHPHGLFSIGAGLLAIDLIRKGEPVAMVASSHLRWFNPVLKLLLDMAGIELVGASSKEVQAAMKRGEKSLVLVVGGYEEAVMTKHGFERLYLRERLGFVKYAIKYGYSLTPVYAFGENDLYHCASVGENIRNTLAKWKVPVMLFYGDPQYPMLPRRFDSSLNLVVGTPLSINKVPHPGIKYMQAVHTEYIEHLMELYYKNNRNNERPLEIF